jgi:hypothetical protein
MRIVHTKKVYILFFIVSILLALYKEDYAKADLLPTLHNNFFQKHSSECEYIPRTYIANGISGSVRVWKSPGSFKAVAKYPNGTKFNVLYLYTDDKNETWGIFYSYEQKSAYGWLRLSDLQVEYDIISFCQEHRNEFKEYKGEFDNYKVQASAPIIIWSYPGSGKIVGYNKKSDQYHSMVFTYMDDNGYLWGYSAYTLSPGSWRTYWGYSATWICISDPTNDKLPINISLQPTIIPAEDNMQSITSSSNCCKYYVITVLIIITFFVIFIFLLYKYKRNRKKR